VPSATALNSRYLLGSSLSVDAHLGKKYRGLGIAAVVVRQLMFTYAPALQALFDIDPSRSGVAVAFEWRTMNSK